MSEKIISLTESQFLQFEKLSLLGGMAAGITHEINNPLNYVSIARDELNDEITELFNELKELTSEPEADEIRKHFTTKFERLYSLLSDIKKGLEKVSKINSSMRNYSRIEHTTEKNIDFTDILEETEIILSNKLKQWNYKKVIEVSLPLIECNRSQISQVYANLLSNACDSLKEKKSKNRDFIGIILCKINLIKKNVLQLILEDNGVGISDEIQQKIFEPFFTTKSKDNGMGLGLSISMNIIKNHKGTLYCSKSTELGGAMFTIDLPIHPNE